MLYRSPSASNTESEEMFKVLNVLAGKDHSVIMGDFNYPGINWDNFSSSQSR